MQTPSIPYKATSRRGNWALFLALAGIIILFFSACRKDSSDIDPPSGGGGGGVYTHVAGLVVAENGTPVAGVNITCGNKTATTDVSGAFLISNVNTDGRCYAHATKAGYFPGSAGVPAKANGISQVRITLLSDAPNVTFSAGAGTDQTLPGGAKVVISGNSVVDANGQAYTGTVSLAVRHLDPDAPEFPAIMPGGDLVATGPDGDQQLISYGMMMLRMTDAGGNELQLADGSTADVAMPVPASLVSGAPQEMPLWHFNETTGKWEQEGILQLQGGAYVASLGHFSSWNADLPTDRAMVQGRVLDCNGQPVEGLTVNTGQSIATTDANGYFERYVPTGIVFQVRVDVTELGLSSEVRTVGPLVNGQVVTVEDLHLQCPAYLNYDITCTNGGALFGYAILNTPSGVLMLPISSTGQHRIAVPATGGSAQLVISSSNVSTITTDVQLPSAIGQSTEAGSFELCPGGGTGSGDYVSSCVLNGDGYNNQTVSIAVMGPWARMVYDPSDSTSVGFVNGGVTGNVISFMVGFDGQTTGTWNGEDDNIMVGLTLDGVTYINGEDFTLQVTEYGAVGGHVRCTFSGTMSRFSQTGEETMVTVTNGSMDMMRYPDQE